MDHQRRLDLRLAAILAARARERTPASKHPLVEPFLRLRKSVDRLHADSGAENVVADFESG
jgi:hypothetical protein